MSQFVLGGHERVAERLPEGGAHDAVDHEVDGAVECVQVAYQWRHDHHPEWRPKNQREMDQDKKRLWFFKDPLPP